MIFGIGIGAAGGGRLITVKDAASCSNAWIRLTTSAERVPGGNSGRVVSDICGGAGCCSGT